MARSRKAIHGTGLGLSIVAGLLHANDGDAWYEPGDPRGSRFCLRLPCAH
jgi:signal transduction histidine kinase